MHESSEHSLGAPQDAMTEPAVRAVFDSLAVGVVVADLDGHARHVNGAWRSMSGLRDIDSAGLGWLEVIAPADRDGVRQHMTTTVRDGHAYEDTWRTNGTHGPPRLLRICADPLRNGARAAGMVATVTDVTDDRARTAQLFHAATHDALTGLLNRRHVMEFIGRALERRSGEPPRLVALLFIDVDRLKHVNDEAGHAAGDAVLVTAARSIRRNVRPADVVARFAGDEFVVLCDDLHDPAEAESISDRIIAAAAAPSAVRDAVGLTIGIAFADGSDDDPEALIERADEAMYRAKHAGRARYETAAPGWARTLRRNLAGPDTARFVAIAAHELRTPLGLVTGFAETLRSHRTRMNDDDIDKSLATIVRQGARMNALIEDLLDLSEVAAKRPAPQQSLLLTDVVADALSSAPPPDSATVSVVERRAGLAVLAEPMGLSRVLVNLLTNAYKYGGPHIVIDLRDDVDDECVLTVRDDGAGLPPDLMTRLFEPFSRGSNSRNSVGTGLGLALSRALVESWGGDLTYAPPGPGTCAFDVRLPAALPA